MSTIQKECQTKNGEQTIQKHMLNYLSELKSQICLSIDQHKESPQMKQRLNNMNKALEHTEKALKLILDDDQCEKESNIEIQQSNTSNLMSPDVEQYSQTTLIQQEQVNQKRNSNWKKAPNQQNQQIYQNKSQQNQLTPLQKILNDTQSDQITQEEKVIQYLKENNVENIFSTVYKTYSGAKFHTADCDFVQVETLQKWKAYLKGLIPCKVCSSS